MNTNPAANILKIYFLTKQLRNYLMHFVYMVN